MRVLLEWLREYVAVDLTAAELAKRLNASGLKTESVEGAGADAVIELEITSNRGDCLSMLGVAIEVAAVTDGSFRKPQFQVPETAADINELVTVEILDVDLCPRYAARLIQNVKVQASPPWMQKRLEAAGMRPINNIVDITNYVMLEMGQPLHAFDNAKLSKVGGRTKIIVRRARDGERLTTIDGVERELNPDMLVIADANVPVALAGVMGGEATEVGWNTKEVLLESAHFNPANNRRTAKTLDLPSEATRRFQRFVDPNGAIRAADRAAQLMAELTGAKVARGVVDVYPRPIEPRIVAIRPKRCREWLGVDVPQQEIRTLLAKIGLNEANASDDSQVRIKVPTRRPDITREADLIEEVARLKGYDQIPSALPHGSADHPGESDAMRGERRAREILRGCGLNEVVTFSLTNAAAAERAGLEPGSVAPWALDGVFIARNPLSVDASEMRLSMLPGMLEALSNNMRTGIRDIHLFEIGRIYLTQQESALAHERRTVAIGMTGKNWTSDWNLTSPSAKSKTLSKAEGRERALPQEGIVSDFYTLKGIVEELLGTLRIQPYQFRNTSHPTFHPSRCAELIIAERPVGVLGELRKEVAERYDLQEKTCAAELDFDSLAQAVPRENPRYVSLPRFPAVHRDIALSVDEDRTAKEIEVVIRESGAESLRDVEVFDVFRGGSLPEGKKSIAFSLTFRADDRTLTDPEVDEAMKQIQNACKERLGATLR